MKYLYRIVNILLAAAVFPIVIFLDLVKIRIGDGLGELLGAFTGGTESSSLLPVGLEEGISIKFLIDVYTGKGEGTFWHQLLMNSSESGSFNMRWPEALNGIKAELITIAVCFVIVLLAALFIIVWSCISNKRIPVVAGISVGTISLVIMRIVFEPVSELIRTSVSITDFIADGGIISTLAGSIIKLEDVIPGSFWIILLFLFIGLAIWTGSYYLIEIGDSPEEKAAAQAKRAKKLK